MQVICNTFAFHCKWQNVNVQWRYSTYLQVRNSPLLRGNSMRNLLLMTINLRILSLSSWRTSVMLLTQCMLSQDIRWSVMNNLKLTCLHKSIAGAATNPPASCSFLQSYIRKWKEEGSLYLALAATLIMIWQFSLIHSEQKRNNLNKWVLHYDTLHCLSLHSMKYHDCLY